MIVEPADVRERGDGLGSGIVQFENLGRCEDRPAGKFGDTA